LKFLENEIEVNGLAADSHHLTARLKKLEKEANDLNVPIAYVTMIYLLREQITVVRGRLKGPLVDVSGGERNRALSTHSVTITGRESVG
jgi:hypothetical protein